MLAMNPDVQEKVFKEQCEIYQDLDSPTTLATINEMKYLDMVIKESLRLSTAIGVVRQITKDIDIGKCLIQFIYFKVIYKFSIFNIFLVLPLNQEASFKIPCFYVTQTAPGTRTDVHITIL